MMTLWFLLAPLRCAFYYRWRGMAHGWNDTVNRLMYAGALGAECTMVALSWRYPPLIGLACAAGAFAGACMGHASAQGEPVDEYFNMANIVAIMNILLILPFWVYLYAHGGTDYPFIWSIAPLFSWITIFSCWLGYKMRTSLTLKLFGEEIDWCVPHDSSWEEFYIGMFPIGLLIAFLGLMGY